MQTDPKVKKKITRYLRDFEREKSSKLLDKNRKHKKTRGIYFKKN